MIIYNPFGETLLDIIPDDDSSRTMELMGNDYVSLNFSTTKHVEIPIGAYILLDGTKFSVVSPEDVTIEHSKSQKCVVTFQSPSYKARISYVKNNVDRRLSFDLTAKPHEHVEMVIASLNEREPIGERWTLGDCIENDERLVTYDYCTAWDALKSIADTFDTEFEIVGKTIHLHMVEYDKDSPTRLAYGKGNGLKSGVVRRNKQDYHPLDVLFAQGGDRNISMQDYGSATLRLPRNTNIKFDGTHFEGEEGYDTSKEMLFLTDMEGTSVSRELDGGRHVIEGVLDCTECYPKRVCTATGVVAADASKNFYDIIDDSISEDLDYSEHIIPGEKMSVVFQSGMLSGKEFEVSNYFHEQRRFEIVPQEIDGVIMPNDEEFRVQVGDEFVVFGCKMPNAYISNVDYGAEYIMLRKCVRHLYQNSKTLFSFTGTLDGIWFKQQYDTLKDHIKIGHYVRFYDDGVARGGVDMRISHIKSNINNPYDIDVNFDNAPVKSSFVDEFKRVSASTSRNERNTNSVINQTRGEITSGSDAIWSILDGAGDAHEAVGDALGGQSTRFRFLDDEGNTINAPVSYVDRSDSLSFVSAKVQIQRQDEPTLSPTSGKTYKEVDAPYTAMIAPSRSTIYLYVKVKRTFEGDGIYVASSRRIPFEDASSDEYYFYYIGYLPPAYDYSRTLHFAFNWVEDLSDTLNVTLIRGTNDNLDIDLAQNQVRLKDGGKMVSLANGELKQQDGAIIRTFLGSVEKINELINRANLLVGTIATLKPAIEDFNANQQAVSANKIDWDGCTKDECPSWDDLGIEQF